MNKLQTDNSFFYDKVCLRVSCLPELDTVLVLDAFHGEGRIWQEVARRTSKHIELLSIDLNQHKKGLYLKGDNRKFLAGMDLSRFDVIDLDAYGIPFDQLILVLRSSRPGTQIFLTFIQSVMGCLPKRMLYHIGYSRPMVDKIPTLFYRDGFSKLKQFLAQAGVTSIRYRQAGRKWYAAFSTPPCAPKIGQFAAPSAPQSTI